MPHDILYTETNVIDGDVFAFVKPKDQNAIVRISTSLENRKNYLSGVCNVFKEVLLPQGYPESVSKDYISYQLWDTLQAFCSTISNTLTTQAILKGVGVGDEVATATSAAITWILKDGTGMIARIVFAWLCGSGLDSECKKWRFFADIVNDLAMCIELSLLPYFPEYSLHILCFSTSMKAVVGVAGGATRAAITQHQAIVENSGDVSAKDGSQETCVNLLASLVGIVILSIFGESRFLWYLFCLMTIIHLYSNYKAVKSLTFSSINPERFAILTENFLTCGKILDVSAVNYKESVIIGTGINDRKLCGFTLKLGCSLRNLVTENLIRPQEFNFMTNLFKERQFMIFPCIKKQIIFVVFRESCLPRDVLEAYFLSLYYGISCCYILGIELDIFRRKEVDDHNSPLTRLQYMAERFKERGATKITMDALILIDEMGSKEISQFINGITSQDWKTRLHNLNVHKWFGHWSEK